MKNISARGTKQTRDYLKSHFKTQGAGAEYLINASPAVARKFIGLDIKGKFSKGELSLMIDAMNGKKLTAGFAGQHLIMDVTDGISLDNLDKKWDINGSDLVKKIKAMSAPDLFFFEIWIQGYWQQCDDISVEDYISGTYFIGVTVGSRPPENL